MARARHDREHSCWPISAPVCQVYQDEMIPNVRAARLQVDEILQFVYANATSYIERQDLAMRMMGYWRRPRRSQPREAVGRDPYRDLALSRKMNAAGWVLLRISVVPLVLFTVASALFAVFHAAAILLHALVKDAGRLGTLLEGALLVVALLVSIFGGLLACRAFWRGTSHRLF